MIKYLFESLNPSRLFPASFTVWSQVNSDKIARKFSVVKIQKIIFTTHPDLKNRELMESLIKA